VSPSSARRAARFDAILDCVFELERVEDGFVIRGVNEAGAALARASREALVGEPFGARLPAWGERALLERLVRVHETGEAHAQEVDDPATGTWFVKVVPTDEGVIVGMHDIAEIRRTSEALARSERRFRRVSELVADWAYCVRVRGERATWEWVTEGFERIVGRAAGDGDIADLVHPGDRAARVAHLRRIAAGQRSIAELRVRRADGAWIWVRDYAQRRPCESRDGELVVCGAAEEITAEVEARREIDSLRRQNAQMQRFETMAALSAGVAHEFNNLLMPIVLGSEGVLATLSRDHPARADLHSVQRAAERAAQLVGDLRALGAQTDPEPEPVDLAEAVRVAVPLLRRSRPEPTDIALDLVDDVWVHADADQLHQVIFNLALNALHASVGRDGAVRLGTAVADGDAVLTVEDRGTGISDAVASRIFEPFFTTKGSGGSGLGLSAVRRIVQSHGGQIAVESEPGSGTRVQVRLPRVDPPREAHERQARILVVDDSALVAGSIADALREVGFAVEVAGGGAEALAILEARPDAYDLLLCDERMPGMSGSELSARLPRPVPVVLITGRAGAHDAHRDGPSPAHGYLTKLVDRTTLLRAIEEGLARRPAR